MKKTVVYNQKGEKTKTISLTPKLLNISENQNLIHQVVVARLSNVRQPLASVKTRAEVKGGGRKPWKQKGTGRARAGSIRSPLWRGGGVVFGPSSNRNFTKNLPKKMKQKALLSALSNKLKSDKFIVLDKIEFSKIKTKQIESMLQKLPIKEGTILLVLSKMDPRILLSSANLPYLKTIAVSSLNLLDLLKYDWLILTKDSLKLIEETHLK